MKVAHFSSHGCLFLPSIISSAINDAISCAILRGWQGPGGWVLWLVGWTTCAGFMQDFAGENGVGQPAIWEVEGFLATPMMLKSTWFHLVFLCFFFPCHIFGLLHFSLVHKMLEAWWSAGWWCLSLIGRNKQERTSYMDGLCGPLWFLWYLDVRKLAFHPSSQHTR